MKQIARGDNFPHRPLVNFPTEKVKLVGNMRSWWVQDIHNQNRYTPVEPTFGYRGRRRHADRDKTALALSYFAAWRRRYQA
jgi:hypothetical protein